MRGVPAPAAAGMLVAVVAALAPAPASADLVRLTNGRVIKVEVCRFEGDRAILVMPGGGEVRTPRSMVAELLPDEEPDEIEEAISWRDRSEAARARPTTSWLRA